MVDKDNFFTTQERFAELLEKMQTFKNKLNVSGEIMLQIFAK